MCCCRPPTTGIDTTIEERLQVSRKADRPPCCAKESPGAFPLRFLRVLSILFDSAVGFCQKLRISSVLLADVYVARVGRRREVPRPILLRDPTRATPRPHADDLRSMKQKT